MKVRPVCIEPEDAVELVELLEFLDHGVAGARRVEPHDDVVALDVKRPLGQLLERGRQLSDMAQVFSGILAILAVGIAVELCVFAPIERWVLRRRGLLQR